MKSLKQNLLIFREKKLNPPDCWNKFLELNETQKPQEKNKTFLFKEALVCSRKCNSKNKPRKIMTYIRAVLYSFTSWWEIFYRRICGMTYHLIRCVSEGATELKYTKILITKSAACQPTIKASLGCSCIFYASPFKSVHFRGKRNLLSVKEWRKTESPSKSISNRFSTELALSIIFYSYNVKSIHPFVCTKMLFMYIVETSNYTQKVLWLFCVAVKCKTKCSARKCKFVVQH